MRKSLEDLVFIGHIEKPVDVYGRKWTLATLNSTEQLDAVAATDGYDTLTRVNALKIEILARALKRIDDIELPDVQENIEFIGKLQTPIINALYNKYEGLQKEQEDSLKDLEDLKN